MLQTVYSIFALFLCAVGSTLSLPQPQGRSTPALTTPVNGPAALALDHLGHLYIVEMESQRVLQLDLSSGLLSSLGSNDFPSTVAVNPSGNVLIGSSDGHLREVNPTTGVITMIAGSGRPSASPIADGSLALRAPFSSIDGLAVAADGRIFVADRRMARIFEIDPSGTIATIAGTGHPGFSGDGGPATNASFRFTSDLALDKLDNLFIADSGNCRIRRVDHLTGIVTTIAITGKVDAGGPCREDAFPESPAVDSDGSIYFIQGNRVLRIEPGTSTPLAFAGSGLSQDRGDGGPALKARLNGPSGLAVDDDGNLFIAEFTGNRIRRVDAKTGVITTVAGNGLPHRRDIQM